MSDKKLRVIPLGGLGEVGKNMMAYEYDENILVVDAGLMFPEGDHLGVDYIIPDMGYLAQNRDRLTMQGIFVTHGHEDHTGAISHLLDVVDAPTEHVYNVPVTLAPVFPGEQVGIDLNTAHQEIAKRTAQYVRLEGGNDLVYLPLIYARLGRS